jgi:hypothetical protein
MPTWNISAIQKIMLNIVSTKNVCESLVKTNRQQAYTVHVEGRTNVTESLWASTIAEKLFVKLETRV